MPNWPVRLYWYRFKGQLFADTPPAEYDAKGAKIDSLQTYGVGPDVDGLIGKIDLHFSPLRADRRQ
jgi:hypothetical protein